jgi:hypothetical protein
MTIEERANQAAEWKAAGIYNCAQAVTQAFADQIPVEAETLKKLGAGYAAGMGYLRRVDRRSHDCRYFDGRKRDAGGFQTAGGRFSGKMRCDNL